MQGSTKIPITDLNAHITCKICSGYFVDASTIIECLHTFCRSCIIKYLQKNKYCPVCDVQVHKSKPLLNIRPDKTLQDIVYKLVPRLFQNEMRRRREFYDNHPEGKEQCGEVAYQYLLTPEETICLTLSYHGADNKPRYLRCPAAVSMGHLKKLIGAKYDLSDNHRIEILYNQDCLSSSLTLMDVAYIYLWKRKGPIELTYRIYENTSKQVKLETPDRTETINNNNIVSNNNNWKEVQLRISENGEMSITGIQDSALSPSLLEIVNSESNYKNETTTTVTIPDSKKESPVSKASSETVSLTNSYVSSSIDLTTISSRQSSSGCATLSSGCTTTVFSTINTTKCSTKSEESLTENERNLKRKSERNVDVEPPIKQSKPIILNHNIGLLNLSNNHPLKKHSKLNRNGENVKDAINKMSVNSTVKPLALRAKTLISESGVKPPCYQPRTVYGSIINVPRPVATSTSVCTVPVVSGSVSVSTKSEIKSSPSILAKITSQKTVVTVTASQDSPPNRNDKTTTTTTTTCQQLQQQPPIQTVTDKESTTSTNKLQTIPGIPRKIQSDNTGKCTVLSVHTFPPPQTTQMTTASPSQQSAKISIKTKPSTPIGYKTLRDPPKSWNSQISKANLSKSSPDPKYSDLKNVRPAKFFKMRNNMPRYLGNPASGVKPMYQLHVAPEKEKTEIKKHSIVKIDPKTLKPVSEKAPETTSLSNHNSANQNSYPNSSNIQNDLKINTSSVSIFNPLKLQSSPKNDRRSPKSPNSPKIKSSNSPTGNKRDKVNLNFTPPNPFVPNIPSKTLSPTQFIYPSMPPGFTPYDPRVMAAYYSQWYGQRIPFAPGLNLDLNQRKSLDILTSPGGPKMDALTQSMLNHQIPIRPPAALSSSPSLSPSPRSHLSSPTITKPAKKTAKDAKNDKSLETVVEKMTQNLNKLTKETEIQKNPQVTDQIEEKLNNHEGDQLLKMVASDVSVSDSVKNEEKVDDDSSATSKKEGKAEGKSEEREDEKESDKSKDCKEKE